LSTRRIFTVYTSHVLFDLDGTITDPALGITNSVFYALRELGIPCPAREELFSFIGPPLKWSFAHMFGMDEAATDEAVRLYRVYYADTGIFEAEVYPGIPEALEKLRAAGLRLAVATAKPEPFAVRVMEHYGAAGFFDTVSGAGMDERKTEKAAVIREALRRMGLPPAGGVMVGDREYDVLGAKAVGLPCVGALWGYGSREELAAAGASVLAEKPADIPGSILRGE